MLIRAHGSAVRDFDALYREHFHEVQRWIRYRGGLPADVDDLAQEVFQVVLRRLPGFDGMNEKAWLYAITRRVLSSYHRHRRLVSLWRAAQREEPRYLAAAADTEASLASRRQVEQLLAQLSDKLRAVFLLYEVEGYDAEEIGRLEGIPVNTVYSRLRLARARFLALLGQAGGRP